MIEWKDFDIANPPEDGQYLVFCEAHQFDSNAEVTGRPPNGTE